MRFKKRRSKLKWPVAGIGPVDWDEIEEQGLPGQSYEEFLKTVPKLKAIDEQQGVISWRASGDRQISLSASDERAFANFRVKNVVFTGTHFCAVLSMVGERAFVNFRKFVN